MKKKSDWWIWTLLAVVLAMPIGLVIWTMVDPSLMDSHNKGKVTEQNFRDSLVLKASIVATIVPYETSVFYMTANGEFVPRDVTIYGYLAKVDGSHCAQYLNKNDNPKQVKVKEICLYPEWAVSAVDKGLTDNGPSWIEKTIDSVSKWPMREKIGKYYNELGALGSP